MDNQAEAKWRVWVRDNEGLYSAPDHLVKLFGLLWDNLLLYLLPIFFLDMTNSYKMGTKQLYDLDIYS